MSVEEPVYRRISDVERETVPADGAQQEAEKAAKKGKKDE